MHRQMENMELIVNNTSSYVEKVFSLLTNDQYQESMANLVREGLARRLKRNSEVASEWLSFMARLTE
jgi:hypothetical protein